MPRQPDSILIAAQPDEIVLNAAQQGRLASVLAAGAGDRDANVTMQVVLDGKVIAQSTIKSILKDHGGIRKVIRKVAAA